MDRCKINTPIGFYNLGHTCAMSAVLQCLVHCFPLQNFFLNEIGHHHEAYDIYRKMELERIAITSSKGSANHNHTSKQEVKDDVCLASEMDKLYLQYFSSTIGYDVFSLVKDLKLIQGNKKMKNEEKNVYSTSKGQPLTLTDMLTAVWKCKGMKHIAGYDQRDAHEFLHGFLENLGKDTQRYRDYIQLAMDSVITQPDQSEQQKPIPEKKSEHGKMN